jgi:tRNA U34 5-methylaminomethyl-2-thiouridine-forming methyltransferase MnmC
MNEIRITGDGSVTLFDPALNEHFHSTFGAITESKHVFIDNGLHATSKDNLAIFEIGFGTGLNAFMTILDTLHHHRNITYYAIEKFPVPDDILPALNYCELLAPNPTGKDIFSRLHKAPWGVMTAITPGFHIFRIAADMRSFLPDFRYDLIYYDAFAPEKQPELWTTEIFSRLYEKLNTEGILTTYCVKGDVKRMLKKTGFAIEKLPGPPGKREMLRATKTTVV